MSETSFHPAYSAMLADWQLLRDAYDGETAIKRADVLYLPPTPGQVLDGMLSAADKGRQNYEGYKARARFPDYVEQAVSAMVGVMHSKPAVIEVPARLEPMLARATIDGEPMGVLLRRLNQEQLIMGRIGMLLDVPDGAPANGLPYIATYDALSIINWDDGSRSDLVAKKLNLAVLDESAPARDGFNWSLKNSYRVLVLGDLQANEPAGIYRAGVFDDISAFSDAALRDVSFAGRKLNEIPFVIVNARDLVNAPEKPPLLGLARLCLQMYRAEADYRQALFMSGQDTLVVVGGANDEDALRVGAGARIDVAIGGDAKYIGVSGKGLPEMRQALDTDRKEAKDLGGKLLDTRGGDAESGEALRIRVGARTASLRQIALTGAAALEAILKVAARWVGADDKQVKVTPNLDFADESLEGKVVVELMTAKGMGAPLSLRSIHDLMRARDITSMTYEDELSEIETEEPAPDEPEPDDE